MALIIVLYLVNFMDQGLFNHLWRTSSMANRTDPAAKSIRGTNPQNLVEKILRSKIYQNTYWKEQCFGLTAETLVDKAMELEYLGGTFGGSRKPTPFMCLVMKMLQIQPEKEIVIEFIKNEDYKYFYLFIFLCMTLPSPPPLECLLLEKKVLYLFLIIYRANRSKLTWRMNLSSFRCRVSLPWIGRGKLDNSEILA